MIFRPCSGQPFCMYFFRPDKRIGYTVHRAYPQRPVLMLQDLVYYNRTAPVPGLIVLSKIVPRIKAPSVLSPGRIPSINKTILSIRPCLSRIKSSSVKGIHSGFEPWSFGGPTHTIIGTESVRITGINQIIPVSHLKEVRTLISSLMGSRCVKRSSVFPVSQVI